MTLSTFGPTTVSARAGGAADCAAYLRIGELARRSGLPVTTIRHYANEGLLGAARKTSRNMAYYPPEALQRIALVKTLQDELYLPLKVVKKILEAYEELEPDPADLDLLLHVRTQLLERHPDLLPEVGGIPASAAEQLELSPAELQAIEHAGLVSAHAHNGQKSYNEVDYRVLKALSGVRAAGLSAELAHVDDLWVYAAALKKLAKIEALLFARRIASHKPEADMLELLGRAIPAVNEVISSLHHKFLLEELRAPAGEQSSEPGKRTKGGFPKPTRAP